MSASSGVPRISMPNPHIRKPSLSSQLHTELSGQTATPHHDEPVPSIPAHHLQRKRSESPSIEDTKEQRPSSVINGLPPPPPPLRRTASGRYVAPEATKKSRSSPMASHDSGYSSSAPATKSPVVPFRSMFPAYDPSVPLAQQAYHPTRPLQVRTARSPYSSSARDSSDVTGMTPLDRALGPRTTPPSIYDTIPETPTPRASTQKELLALWQATHGMEPNSCIKSYNLELTRTNEATFSLGSSPTNPFYSMVTYDTNEIALSKTHPRKPTVQCEVSLNCIEPASRRFPPNDGLVTFIFPKMAAMLAVNQSTALALEHGLAPTHRDEIQADAVRRAAKQESCRLLWNAIDQHYVLEHPAVGRKSSPASNEGPSFTESPDLSSAHPSAVSTSKLALDVSVSTFPGHALPTITISHLWSSPSSTTSTPTVPGIRLSTIPQRETDSVLATLDFNTRILTINANSILTHVPSLFAIDSIVSAILTTAVADEAVNPVMADMEVWTPSATTLSLPPPGFRRHDSQREGSVAGSATGSIFYATFAEREEAEAEAKALAAIHQKDIKNKSRKRSPEETHRFWFGKSNREKKTKFKEGKKKRVEVAEFDLEKLTHYQSGSREGQKLPGVSRAILRALIGGLKMIVLILTAIVQFFVWILVHVTRGITSEKF